MMSYEMLCCRLFMSKCENIPVFVSGLREYAGMKGWDTAALWHT